MLFQVVIENGVKKIKPLTADTGSGNPVGTILPLYKKSNPIGYLYCDGSTFDETVYPALYAYLGTNVLPDYREFALVGAEENTTDVYDASTNPNGTIHDHDVYTEGQAKDDQLQTHNHSVAVNTGGETSAWIWKFGIVDGYAQDVWGALVGSVSGARAGSTTRGKRKAVYFYIKATSGVMEDNTENFINVINAERSYSTTEINTGKKWIDGKPIYRKCYDAGSYVSNIDWDVTSLNIDVLINSQVIGCNSADGTSTKWTMSLASGVDSRQAYLSLGHFVTSGDYYKRYAIIEYTKTTD